MKKIIFIAIALLIGIALSYALFFRGDANALQVNQVAADPSAYSGTITVAGIMAGTSQQDPSVFGIFDIKELQCKTPNCNKIYLPVKYQGALPKLGDEVQVSGNITQVSGNYIFSATNVKVVRNHRIGG
jgi:acetamidase/formamidase